MCQKGNALFLFDDLNQLEKSKKGTLTQKKVSGKDVSLLDGRAFWDTCFSSGFDFQAVIPSHPAYVSHAEYAHASPADFAVKKSQLIFLQEILFLI